MASSYAYSGLVAETKVAAQTRLFFYTETNDGSTFPEAATKSRT